ncbi:MAG: hypothetical protein ACK4MQ_03795 [Hyphomonas sp.]
MQSDRPTETRIDPAHPEAPVEPDPDTATPGDGERIHPVDARAANRFGIWKVLAASLLLAVLGLALITALFNG